MLGYRAISEEELNAIVTLIQSAENIGTCVFTEEEILDALKKVYDASPATRAKDVGFHWMLNVITRTYEILSERANADLNGWLSDDLQ